MTCLMNSLPTLARGHAARPCPICQADSDLHSPQGIGTAAGVSGPGANATSLNVDRPVLRLSKLLANNWVGNRQNIILFQ